MSKVSVRSKTSSLRSISRRKRKIREQDAFKPFNFCCSLTNFDPLTKYDQRRPPYKSSLSTITSVHECPILKIRTAYCDGPGGQKKKIRSMSMGDLSLWKSGQRFGQGYGSEFDSGHGNEHGQGYGRRYGHGYNHWSSSCSKQRGPLLWFLEDEILLAKDIFWRQKRRMYEKHLEENLAIAIRKAQYKIRCSRKPRWYYEFSSTQLQHLLILERVMRIDYEEILTTRTQKALMIVGIITSEFRLRPNVIRRLQYSTRLNAIEFLKEIYKMTTGHQLGDAKHKKLYGPNEKILLSGIAFLTLPETVVELHKRLPPVVMPKIPPKPILPTIVLKKNALSVDEDLFERPHMGLYRSRLQAWYKFVKRIPMPKVYLPPEQTIAYSMLNVTSAKHNAPIERSERYEKSQSKDTIEPIVKKRKSKDREDQKQKMRVSPVAEKKEGTEEYLPMFDIPRLPDENKKFSFTLSGLSEESGPVQYKICGTLNPPRPHEKSWLGEKDAHYIISGVSDDPPECPVTYEMTGVANVTPTNSDERFSAVLKLGDGDKKIYPSGRKNLSRNWQEWLQNADEEYRTVEREANKIVKSIKATMRLIFPGPTCDSCCSCRQTRKTHLKMKKTKTPYMVIDTVAEDVDNHKYIVGSMAMHSPAPSPVESAVNLLEVIASEDKVVNNVVINGVTNEQGKTQYYITGHKKDKIHVPSRIIELPPPLPPKNVPPCACAIHQMFNRGIEPTFSSDNIPWTKDEGVCFGKKYRPNESPAYSCKKYPGDKSCRRNPFLKDVMQVKRKRELDAEKAIEREKKQRDDYVPEKKRMYSIADFKPCGDEHRMGLCDGPWGALNLFSPEELAELERQRKEILRGPPCGTKPGRAVCEGPFGAKIPMPLRSSLKDSQYDLAKEGGAEGDEAEDEADEEEEEKKETVKEEPVIIKERPKHRGKGCRASPEVDEMAKMAVTKKKSRFIPDPNYPGYDDPWNIFRTAPSKVKTKTDYEKTLRLSVPKRQTPADLRIQSQKSGLGLTTVSSKFSKIADKSFERITPKERIEAIEKKEKTISSGKMQKIDKMVKSDKTEEHPHLGRKAFVQVDKSNARKSKINDKSKKSCSAVSGTNQEKTDKSKEKKIRPVNTTDTKRSEKNHRKEKRLSQTAKFFTKSNGNVKWQRNRNKGTKTNNEPDKTKSQDRKQPVNKFESKQTEERIKSNDKSYKRDKSKSSKSLENNKIDLLKENKSRRSSKSSTLNKSHKKDERHRKRSVEIRRIHPLPESDASDQRKQADQMIPKKYLLEVQPAILPEDPPRKCHPLPEDMTEESSHSLNPSEEVSTHVFQREPCGWRTKSEQDLATKKTLVYLAEPGQPLEEVPVRPGGRSCLCRENRNKKKVLKYNIAGHADKKKLEGKNVSKLFSKKTDEGNEQRRVVDGVMYFTPPPSPRRSDEYVPEYDLSKSPYDMCLNDRKDKFLKLLEKYTLPIGRVPRTLKVQPCGCNDYMGTYGIVELDQANQGNITIPESQGGVSGRETMTFDKLREQMIEAKSPRERWSIALKDVALVDYFTRCRDNVPCWLKCTKYDRAGCPISLPKLIIKKPVCECKYERKIVEQRDAEKQWEERQRRLKTYKKQPLKNIIDISRPIVPDTKLMISGVQRIPKEDEYIDDVKYLITGVSENYRMADPKPLVSVNLVTPVVTPEPSVKDIPCTCLHKHWSEMNLPPGPLPRPDDIEKMELEKRKQAVDDAFRQIYGPHDSDQNLNQGYISCKGTCQPPIKTKDKKQLKEAKESKKNVIEKKQQDSKVKNVELKGSLEKETHNKRIGEETYDGNIKEKGKLQAIDIRRFSGNKHMDYKITDINIKKDISKKNYAMLETPVLEEIKSQDTEIRFSKKDKIQFKKDPIKVMKHVLKEMAGEGFIFANLPKSYLLPELNLWLMYRLGAAFLQEHKKKSLKTLLGIWNMLCALKQPINVTLDFVRRKHDYNLW